ncbi:hypothetical protein ABE29_12760 [Cytobacillus firmus]|nr:hypothetical protein [Cytobacillus firmus]MBG9547081.1 hypothetical protein [Cytobacillus firmus]MBG9551809.1 hypothetical protein [Cytobacillus firmus]MBG9556099.1 hypothetical protein [Cytobacillus firmus]MBG9575613.1 hypothetical protein [Cytobacillus firmus]
MTDSKRTVDIIRSPFCKINIYLNDNGWCGSELNLLQMTLRTFGSFFCDFCKNILFVFGNHMDREALGKGRFQ